MRPLSNPGLRLGPSLVGILFLISAACVGGDSLTRPPVNGGKGIIPWGLEPNYRAINIAVGQEVQLAVQALDADGGPFARADLPAASFSTGDTALTVDATGLLKGRSPTRSAVIVVKMESLEENWSLTDSVRVTVTSQPYSFAGFKLLLDGSPIQPANETRRFDGVVTDQSGSPMLDSNGDLIKPLTYYKVSTPIKEYSVTNGWTGVGTARNISEPTVVGTTYLFGDVYSDSIKIRATYPSRVTLRLFKSSLRLDPSPSHMNQKDATILEGGEIVFLQTNATSLGDDIVFDDLANVIDGDIPVVARSPGSVVVFPKAGTYTYRSTTLIGDVRGTITVVEPPTP